MDGSLIKRLFDASDRRDALRVQRIPGGSNTVKLHVAANDLAGFRHKLREGGVRPPPEGTVLYSASRRPSRASSSMNS